MIEKILKAQLREYLNKGRLVPTIRRDYQRPKNQSGYLKRTLSP